MLLFVNVVLLCMSFLSFYEIINCYSPQKALLTKPFTNFESNVKNIYVLDCFIENDFHVYLGSGTTNFS